MPQIIAPILGAVGTGLATKGVDAIFGGGSRSADRNLSNIVGGSALNTINTPGFTSTITNGKLNLTRSDTLNNLIAEKRGVIGSAVDGLSGLEGQVTPGFGRLTEATEDVFNNQFLRFQEAREASIGTLRDNLARRGILGSSFANDAVIRREREFNRADRELTDQLNLAQSRNFLQELEISTKFILEKAGLSTARIQSDISQLNIESEIALQLSGQVQQVMGQLAAFQAKLEADRLSNTGGLFTDVISEFGKGFGDLAGKIFNQGIDTNLNVSTFPARG